jgi:hypothetical protein
MMSDKVRIFCESVHGKLTSLDGHMDSLKTNVGTTWHYLQEKLADVRERDETHQLAINQARSKLKQWFEDRQSEAGNTIDVWRKNREVQKLSERARQAEVHAGFAMQIAEASIDEVVRMVLEAISARMDAESVEGEGGHIQPGPDRVQNLATMKLRMFEHTYLPAEESGLDGFVSSTIPQH